MSNNLSPSEQLAFVTTRIHSETTLGKVSVGTGFFFSFKVSESEHIPIIVTNCHVIEDSGRGIFQLTRADEDGNPMIGKFENIIIDGFEQLWLRHPNQAVDLCVMPLAPLLREAQKQNKRFFFRNLSEDLLPNQQLLTELTALEEILMIGYPVGIWDSVNNMPVFRRGITATHPNLDYEGREEFLIDAACFPGSSGSPVLLYNLGSYASRQGGTVIGTRIFLLGVLYAGPQYTVEGEIKVVPIPTQMTPIPTSKIPINLGVVIKAKKLLDFKPILTKATSG
jgi:hypothetical protein